MGQFIQTEMDYLRSERYARDVRRGFWWMVVFLAYVILLWAVGSFVFTIFHLT